jgi:alkanesulfonate monooxygenase SsuD/methylene tetrahydromethanopterin reductase-like flavin-dependent oxidoreductase (luciferase family)
MKQILKEVRDQQAELARLNALEAQQTELARQNVIRVQNENLERLRAEGEAALKDFQAKEQSKAIYTELEAFDKKPPSKTTIDPTEELARDFEERVNEEYHAAVAAVEPLLVEIRKTDYETQRNKVLNLLNDMEQIAFDVPSEDLVVRPDTSSFTSGRLRDEQGRFRVQTTEEIAQELQNLAKINEIDNDFHPFGEFNDPDYVVPFDDPDH